MKRLVFAFVSLAAFAAGLSAQAPAPAAAPARGRATTPASTARQGRAAAPAKPLDIYVLDVEGGKSTIFVTPSGQIVMIDTGNPGARDADRILAATKDAGLTQIDHLIITHYHGDHVGGVTDLAARIPIRRFIDHGPNVETGAGADRLNQAYAAARGKGTHVIAKPGDKIPMADAVALAPLGTPPGPAPAVHDGPANWIKVSAQSDGTFTVTNSRNRFSKTYGVTRR